MRAATTERCTQREAIANDLRKILQPGQVVELRALKAKCKGDYRPGTISGYFDDVDKLAAAACSVIEAKGVYFTPQQIDPALLHRAYNRLRQTADEPTTADHDVLRRLWLLVDCDVKRPAGISASNDEHNQAHLTAQKIRDCLAADGWPDPVYADSGNGAHLMYRIELPANDGGLSQRCLQALAAEFDIGGVVEVDRAMFNPARIWKLYGTTAGKGDNTHDRPHRVSKIVECPDDLVVVPADLLEALAARAPQPEPKPSYQSNGHTHNGHSFDIANWIAHRNLDVAGPDAWKGKGRIWIFRACPWNPDHTDKSAFIGQQPNGAILAGCHHNGCKAIGWGWRELRERFEPGYQDRRHERNGSAKPQDAEPPEIDHGWLSFADFMGQDVRQNYLVNGVVPEAQGGIISGRFKTLKTSIAIDLFISMATGTPFLNKFHVPTPVPCGLMTSESGPASIIAIAKRIAAAKGIDYRDGPHLTTNRPRMTDDRHLERLERDIEQHGWRCVGIDPTYMAFAEVGEFCANVYKMGQALEPVTALIQRTGCSIILLNHSTKGRMKDVDRFDPPDLAEISMSGWAEWMRFWLLLSQVEEWDETTGAHSLWMRTGGSAGHAGLHQVNVAEGEHDERGRRTEWTVDVVDVVKVSDAKEKKKADAKAKQRERTEQEHERKLLDALKQCPDGETEKQLSVLSGLNKANLATSLRSLLKSARAEQCTVTKRGIEYDGYRLKPEPGQAGQGGTNGGTVPPVSEGGQRDYVIVPCPSSSLTNEAT